jgi:hypothetical protein
MSDPMTNVQIEDVLSSIRRLVSEDLRPGARPAASASRPANDKLVLTPALRIVPEDRRPAAEPPRPAVAAEITEAFDPLSRRAAAAALEAALSGRADDWEPDGSEVTVLGAEDWAVEWEAETSAPPEFISSRAAPASAASAAAPDASSAAHEEPEAQMDWTDTLDPDAEPVRPSARFTLYEEDQETEAPFLDEDVLRELIRDILREELQGALGERITRNVRKLVRAEIARALAARDFD